MSWQRKTRRQTFECWRDMYSMEGAVLHSTGTRWCMWTSCCRQELYSAWVCWRWRASEEKNLSNSNFECLANITRILLILTSVQYIIVLYTRVWTNWEWETRFFVFHIKCFNCLFLLFMAIVISSAPVLSAYRLYEFVVILNTIAGVDRSAPDSSGRVARETSVVGLRRPSWRRVANGTAVGIAISKRLADRCWKICVRERRTRQCAINGNGCIECTVLIWRH